MAKKGKLNTTRRGVKEAVSVYTSNQHPGSSGDVDTKYLRRQLEIGVKDPTTIVERSPSVSNHPHVDRYPGSDTDRIIY